MDEAIQEFEKQMAQLRATLERLEMHMHAVERVVRSQLPITPDQWNRLLAEAARAIQTERP